MLLKNRLYPYPVITQFGDTTSYANGKFTLSYEKFEDESKDELTLKFKYELDQPTLCKLIFDQKCSVKLLINCSATSFRKTYDFLSNEMELTFKRKEFLDKVEMCAFIIADEEIEDFAPEDLKGRMAGRSFFIEQHDVLGIDEAAPMTVEYNPKDAKNIESIFSVQRDTNQTELLRLDLGTNPKKIIIHVPSAVYDLYYNSKDNIEETGAVYHSLLLLNPLTQVLTMIKHGGFDDLESIEDEYKWFKSIEGSFKKAYQKDMEFDDLFGISNDAEIYEMAQKMLGFCAVNAIDGYYRALTYNLGNGGGSDE